MNGTVIQAIGDAAHAMVLKKDQPPDFDYRAVLKTVNLYKLCRRAVLGELMPALDGYVRRGQTGDFYELAISRAVADGSMPLHVLLTGDRWWTEVDTEEDLRLAETMPMQPDLGGVARGRR